MTIYKSIGGEEISYQIPLIKEDVPLFYGKLRSFINSVKTGGPAPVPSSQILYNQAIIDGICKSAELGREIQIEIPEI